MRRRSTGKREQRRLHPPDVGKFGLEPSAQGSVHGGADPPEPEGPPSPPLPADHVLASGAVLFPVDGQTKLSTELSKAEVVDFINYFQRVHNKKLEKECLVSVVADLRHASLPTVRFITETLLLLELHKRTVHSVYIIQPQKKEVLKLLLKLLTPSKFYPTTLKKIIVKEISELSNYIDKSQLPSSLGGYLIYCHQSWVSFVKEIDAFIQEFVSVVQRLPSCISTLYSLSRMPLPFTFTELQNYFSTNESTFQQLRRELGLDELLRHCETVVEKLHYPEKDPCYLAMAGTALFTHTTFDMLQNHSRITAAVEKVELLWEQAFAKARLQLQVFQLQEDALKITEQIKSLHQEKLQPYRIEIAKDDAAAVKLLSEFEATIYTPAVALVRCAEDVIHTLAKIMPLEGQTKDHWVLDLERLKEKFYSAVQFILQTLRAVSKYHRHYQKANCWYSLVLHDNVLQELLSGVNGDAGSPWRQRKNWGVLPAWRQRISYFLKKNPPPDQEELVYLAHLSSIIPDEKVQQAGKQMSQRCITLRKLLLSPEPVAVGYLQRALQWQYELLRSSYSSADCAAVEKGQDVVKYKDLKEMTVPRTSSAAGLVSADGTPLSLSSFDSGFDGLGNGQPEVLGGRKRLEDLCGVTEIRGSEKCTLILPQLGKDGSACISDTEVHGDEFDCGSVGGSSGASIQIVPKAAVDSLNFEIRVKRSAALPSNPWLSLPVDNLENSYTITVTPNPTPQKKNHQLQEPPDPFSAVGQLFGSKDQPAQTEGLSSTRPRASKSQDCVRSGRSTLEDPELSPVCHILSSTLTEERDKTLSTTEGGPTLLWDSYDLHEQNQDAVDRSIDLSLNDWDVKERETLREVERILDRTDKILEKEENILAQEAVLDAMLSSENQQQQWLWDEENWAEGMSSRELAEAGVLGLDDNLLPAESDSVWEPNSTASAREIKTSDCYNKMIPEAHAQVFHSSSDLLTELRQVHTLDEMIVEEKLKIHMFRQKEMPDEELPRSKILDSNRLSVRKEREAFRLQLEKEKQEVALLEKSLENECKVKERSKKVIRCSIMAKTRAEKKDEKEIMNGRAERETYIGHEAQHMRGVLALKHPIKNGIIQNWDEMEKIWHHAFLQMRVDPEDHPVLLTEAAMNPLENRRRMVEIMFECFNVPFTYVAMQALLQEQGVCMRTTAEVEIVREMKEKCCRVALNYEAELCAGGSSCREMHFTMPDGQIVTVNTERFRAPEILFKPELIGRDHCGIHESLFKSILSSDIDLRRSLLQNIVLSGGNTLLSGFPERLQAEIQGLLPPDTGECVHVISPVDRDFSVWSGGAMLANLQSFNLAWISLEEYEEHGPHIVHRKCF
ncbi:Actin-57B Precursor [Takifugu flavidus]|uniref:Actin-57B n=1 Tax=Takifugu flavidus TaxID=433684 RepID=A0A5C6NMW0_9TELE|nr:Actin-57B Precursor [Takifugu flavidus]